jgi:hypothetical protein
MGEKSTDLERIKPFARTSYIQKMAISIKDGFRGIN